MGSELQISTLGMGVNYYCDLPAELILDFALFDRIWAMLLYEMVKFCREISVIPSQMHEVSYA